MANIKIANLPTAGNLTKTDLLIIDQSNGTNKIDIQVFSNQITKYLSLPEIYVDDFGADPTGVTDSSQAVIDAVNSVKTVSDSAYVTGDTTYFKVVFGNGTYLLGDVPLYSGVIYQGQGNFATRILPKAGSSYCFTTIGTEHYTSGSTDTLKRLFNAGIRDLSIGSAYYETINSIPTGVGGIYLAYASYITLENVQMRRLNGPGLYLEEVWDCDFDKLRMMYVGNVTDINNPKPALYMGMGTGSDGSNALRFNGLHIEACPMSMKLDTGSRHIFFNTPKIEGGTISSTIIGGQGVLFDSPELTWANSTIPQFDISRTSTYDTFGVTFESPVCISGGTATRGWYFRHSSNAGTLAINNSSLRQVAILVTGNNFVVKGGTAYASGPQLINGTGLCLIDNLVWIALTSSTATDGTGDTIILSGLGNRVTNCQLHATAGTTTDSQAFINISSDASDIICQLNSFHGTRQYGIRNVSNSIWIRDNRTVNNGSIGTLISGTNPKYTLTNLNTNGFGVGGVNSNNVTVSSSASGNLSVISGGTLISLRAQNSALGYPSALLYLDANSTTINLVSSTGNIFKTGTGTIGDGFIYISKSGSNLILTNYYSSAVSFYATAISAVI